MLDIHTHLYWQSYDSDRDKVIHRARMAGVKQMIVVGTTPEENTLAISIAEHYEDMFASIGLHPHFFNKSIEEEFSISNFQFSMKPKIFNEKMQQEIEELKKLAMHSKVVAIGECGLDYYSHNQQETINSQQRMLQKAGFIAQLELAVKLKVPVIIHTRPSLGTMDAYEDMWTILQQYSSDSSHLAPPMILHCYQGDTEMTKKFLGLSSVYFSFTGNITYPTKKMFVGTKNDLTETVKMVPLTRLFVETDCPFLAPQEKRGERNEPAYVTIVAEHICALHKVKMIDLEDNLEKNFVRVFARPTL